MTAKASSYPREYLLRIYSAALTHGHVLLSPITKAEAVSFTGSFYRLRRRSDTSNASFILPEYHLVTIGQWNEANGGTLPIYYNTIPETDTPLPLITTPDGQPIDNTPAPLINPGIQAGVPDGDEIGSDFDVDAYVAGLITKSHGREPQS